MKMKTFGLCLCGIMLLSSNAWSRAATELNPKDFGGRKATVVLQHQTAGHRIGAMELAINNNGTIGTGFRAGPPGDIFTGENVASCDYPRGGNVSYLFAGAFWIGAVVGRDTLVSVGADGWSFVRELAPDEPPFGAMVKRSITNPGSPLFDGAISEEDFISVYTDTITDGVDPDYFGRPHTPLNIEITDASYAWSYAYAEDFVLFDYKIRNLGFQDITEVYMGLYVDADVCGDCTNGYTDDLCGFLHTYPGEFGDCVFNDTVNIAWIADNDGDFSQTNPALHVTATRIIRTPAEEMEVSFNWWISNGQSALDFGPRRKDVDKIRDLGTGGLGTPEGDVNKYNFMQNGEFDYDQHTVKRIQVTDEEWLYPNQTLVDDFADGFDTRYLLSFGPFTIRPGQTLPVSLAYVGGMNLHTDPNNYAHLPDDPDQYYKGLDFSDLALNATWAAWIYDNPGVDTDNDGFYGLYHVCCADSSYVDELDTHWNLDDPTVFDSVTAGWLCADADTFFYQGDGVPDFRGAAPPPAPDFWLHPSPGQIRVRFNGLRSETTEDVFSRHVDFEGYRVYVGRDDRAASFGLVASYDVEDYNKLVFVPDEEGYMLFDVPFTVDSLRCLYADSCDDVDFNPDSYTRSRPYQHPNFPESTFIFEAQDYNVSDYGPTAAIRKNFPDQPYPSSLIPGSAQQDELTPDGYLKYFDYETVIDGLLPTVLYYVNVTAFDYGSPESGLSSLETSVSAGAQSTYPLATTDSVASQGLKAYVYPNPYRLDGNYLARGFEGHEVYAGTPPPENRTRLLNFANLPPKCTIRIFTVDGDLVREMFHDVDPADPKASHETWNLITRNTQMVVSGLYYWTIESPSGDVQIGKLAIIM